MAVYKIKYRAYIITTNFRVPQSQKILFLYDMNNHQLFKQILYHRVIYWVTLLTYFYWVIKEVT
jgi:hypothetical protein